MDYSAQGLELTKQFEQCRLKAYPDAKGVPTIGWGHTGPEVKLGMTCTQDEADAWLVKDVQRAVDKVNRCVQVALRQCQFDALVDFTYNVGTGALQTSTLLRKLNQGDYQGAADEILKWDKCAGKTLAGLTRRRVAERELFLA